MKTENNINTSIKSSFSYSENELKRLRD